MLAALCEQESILLKYVFNHFRKSEWISTFRLQGLNLNVPEALKFPLGIAAFFSSMYLCPSPDTSYLSIIES